jgi:stage IV sporulation protein FB
MRSPFRREKPFAARLKKAISDCGLRIVDWIMLIRSPISGGACHTRSADFLMLLGEPPATQADIHFRLFGFPVRVHPFFWLTTLLLWLGFNKRADPLITLIWVVVVFISILIHELGHAIIQRYFGGHPWITLYGLGGLASCNDCDRRPRSQILISLAGPVAGFFLAAFVVAILFALQRFVRFELDWIPVIWKPFHSPSQQWAVIFLLYVNIAWGLVNLLPIYPLDGGQISRQLFLLWNSRTGTMQSLQLSAGAAVLVAAYALLRKDFYLAVMFGFLAYGNFQAMQFDRNHWR